MGQQNAFGHIKSISGKAGTFDASLVPLGILNSLQTTPVPITISGSSNVTFTVAASVTKPVYIWSGRDIIALKSNLSYTHTNDSTNVVISSGGAKTTAQTPGAVGLRYFYAGIDSAGAIEMFPSTEKPSYVEGPFPSGERGHPGTTRDRVWTYMGWAFMSTTAPVFTYAKKIGYTYNVSKHAYAGVATEPGYITMAIVPRHEGIEVGGIVTGAAGGQECSLGGATHAGTACEQVGAWQSVLTGATDFGQFQSFDNLPVNSDGNVLARIEATATTVNVIITRIKDVV